MGGGRSKSSGSGSQEWSRNVNTSYLGFDKLINNASTERKAAEKVGISALTAQASPNEWFNPSTEWGQANSYVLDNLIADSTSGPEYQAAGRNKQDQLKGAAIGLVMNALNDRAQQAATALLMNNANFMNTLTNVLPASGRGQKVEGGSTGGYGINICCFIFLEALNGKLPCSTRMTRDAVGAMNPAMVRGYKRMASWLVPMMQRSTLIRNFVNLLMVRPCVQYGEWVWGYSDKGRFWKPVVSFWFNVWTKLGG